MTFAFVILKFNERENCASKAEGNGVIASEDSNQKPETSTQQPETSNQKLATSNQKQSNQKYEVHFFNFYHFNFFS